MLVGSKSVFWWLAWARNWFSESCVGGSEVTVFRRRHSKYGVFGNGVKVGIPDISPFADILTTHCFFIS